MKVLRRSSRRRVAAALLVSSFVTAAAGVGSCTVFSGLTYDPKKDSGPDAVSTDAADAGDLPGLVTLTQAVQICSKVLTCAHVGPSITASYGIPVDSTNFSQCVAALSGPIDPRRQNRMTTERLACIAKIDGCNVGACVSSEEVDEAPPECVAEAGAAERCERDTAISCWSSVLKTGGWAFHCNNPTYAAGSTCVAQNGYAGCSVGNTSCPPQPRCLDGSETQSRSDSCVDSGTATWHPSIDCRVKGLDCQTGVSGCTGPECGVHLFSTCTDDKTLSVCMFQTLGRLDCSAVGAKGRCETQNTMAYCAGPHEECTPYDPPPPDGKGVNSCDGSSIRACIGGRITAIDCRAVNPTFECRTGIAPKSNYCGPPQ